MSGDKAPRSSAQRRAEPPLPPVRLAWKRYVQIAALLLLAVLALAALDLAGMIGGRDRRRAHFITDAGASLVSFYTPEVRYWQDELSRWAREYGVNPNVLAIVIQIESCGDMAAISGAGALGLMQVMPFHFDFGENMLNPDTNVRRGIGVLKECLTVFARYDLGLAMACYNGGPSVTQRPYRDWAAETRYYYEWATGLWADVVAGRRESATLAAWLDAGGRQLCTQAAQTQSRLLQSGEGTG